MIYINFGMERRKKKGSNKVNARGLPTLTHFPGRGKGGLTAVPIIIAFMAAELVPASYCRAKEEKQSHVCLFVF